MANEYVINRQGSLPSGSIPSAANRPREASSLLPQQTLAPLGRLSESGRLLSYMEQSPLLKKPDMRK